MNILFLAMQAYSEPDAAKMKENLKEQESKLKLMSDYLEGKKFLMGDRVTKLQLRIFRCMTPLLGIKKWTPKWWDSSKI